MNVTSLAAIRGKAPSAPHLRVTTGADPGTFDFTVRITDSLGGAGAGPRSITVFGNTRFTVDDVPVGTAGISHAAPEFYLVRHLDGRYELGEISDPASPLPSGRNLRGTRCLEVAPLPREGSRVVHSSGYDCGGVLSHHTAWIMRGQAFLRSHTPRRRLGGVPSAEDAFSSWSQEAEPAPRPVVETA